MKKILGIAGFLLLLYLLLLLINESARSSGNHFNLSRRIGSWGVLGLGICFLIITGNIDLSIGSFFGMCAVLWAMLTFKHGLSPCVATLAVLGVGAVAGLVHGLLVTKLKLQSFVVTLCGLFIYRGMARALVGGESVGVSDLKKLEAAGPAAEAAYREFWQQLYVTQHGPHFYFWLCLLLAGVLAVILHFSVYGRYLYAIGNNERAARFSGIATDRCKIAAFMLCSMLAALASVMFVLEFESVQPSSAGATFELYAIAAAVLGGCSLRGGKGTVAGVLIGTAIIVILENFARLYGVKDDYVPIVIGTALLLGAVLDEVVRQGWFGQLRRLWRKETEGVTSSSPSSPPTP
jgi:ribose transport system permease protein